MDSTFKFRQNLSSKEFGFLLYHTFPKGVISKPSVLEIQSGTAKCTGGSYIMYNGEKKYGVVVDLGEDSATSVSIQEQDVGNYLYIRYRYSESADGSVYLSVHPFDMSDIRSVPKEDFIRLGRILKDENTNLFFLDDSCIEYSLLRNHNYNMDASRSLAPEVLCMFSYNITDPNQKVIAKLTGEFITDSVVVSNPSLDTSVVTFGDGYKESIKSSGAYFVFLDSTGRLQLCKDSTPRGTKFIIAEKSANSNFRVYSNPRYGTLDLNSFELNKITLSNIPDKSMLPSLKDCTDIIEGSTDPYSQKTNYGKLLKAQMELIDKLIGICNDQEKRIQILEDKCTALNSNYHSQGKDYLDVVNLRLNGELIAESLSSFGSQNKPLNKLYVKDTLVTDTLSIQ